MFEDFIETKGIIYLMYYPLFFLRRTSYIVILYNLASHPGIQVSLNVVFTLIVILYIWILKPFKINRLNQISLIQEILLCFIFVLSGLFIQNFDSQTERILENIMIGIISLNIICNYVYIILDGIMKVKNHFFEHKIIPINHRSKS